MKNFLSLLTLSCLLIFACNKEEVNPIPQVNTPDGIVRSMVTSSVSGFVVNEFDIAVEGAMITYEGYTTTSDENGAFLFQNIEMNENGSYIVADKDGFFPGSTMCSPQPNVKANVRIKLIQKCANGQVTSGQGGTVPFNGDARIILPENYIDANGNPYNGTVTVSAHWIDPFHHDLGDVMPGELIGVNEEGEVQALISYGMMAVELVGDDGAELQLAEGETATLKFPVPADALGSAPPTIPLWYFDEVEGIWVEEGSAVLENGYYVGEVSHFSFWNCDYPGDLITINGQVVDENNIPMPNVEVFVTIDNMGCGYEYTDDHGYFGGYVPAGFVLHLQVKIPGCGVVYEADYGPYDVDTNLGQIVIPTYNISTLTVTGTVVDYSGNPMGNALVSITTQAGNYSLVSEGDGSFTTALNYCDDAGINLSVQVHIPECNIFTNAEYGPLTTDTDLGQIDISISGVSSANISGVVMSCDGNPISDATVNITTSQGNYATVSGPNGILDYNISFCDNSEVSVFAYDAASNMYTITSSTEITGDYDFGNLLLCDEGEGFFAITGGSVGLESSIPCLANTDGSTTSILMPAYSELSGFTWNGTGVGTFGVTDVLGDNGELLLIFGLEVTISSYDASPGGSIVGTFTDLQQGAIISGNFVAIMQ